MYLYHPHSFLARFWKMIVPLSYSFLLHPRFHLSPYEPFLATSKSSQKHLHPFKPPPLWLTSEPTCSSGRASLFGSFWFLYLFPGMVRSAHHALAQFSVISTQSKICLVPTDRNNKWCLIHVLGFENTHRLFCVSLNSLGMGRLRPLNEGNNRWMWLALAHIKLKNHTTCPNLGQMFVSSTQSDILPGHSKGL